MQAGSVDPAAVTDRKVSCRCRRAKGRIERQASTGNGKSGRAPEHRSVAGQNQPRGAKGLRHTVFGCHVLAVHAGSLRRKKEIRSLFSWWSANAKTWRTSTTSPQGLGGAGLRPLSRCKIADRDLLRHLGPVTQECSAEGPSVSSVASGGFGLLLPWLGR